MKKTKSYALSAFLLVGIMSACNKMEDLNMINPVKISSANLILDNTSQKAIVETPIGLYAMKMFNQPQDDAILQNTSIDGIYVRVTWNSIESSKGIYDWSFIDSEIDRAIANNKKVQIAIIAGEYTPSWVEDKGVPFLDFKVIPHGGEGHPHWTHIPIVWDTKFVSYYITMVKAFASHLKASSTRYAAVSLIKVYG
jgi:hypothetical protein